MTKKVEHKLTIEGGTKNTHWTAGSCSCGNFTKFSSYGTIHGNVARTRKFIREQFNIHKAGN
jgi:hypothetical protein